MIFFNFKSNREGFTLIELLVVVAIISLLTSIVLASLQEARDKAKGTVFRQEVQELIKAIELYRLNEDGRLPLLFQGNDPPLEPNTSIAYFLINSDGVIQATANNNDGLFEQRLDLYLKKIPIPPFDGFLMIHKGGAVDYKCTGQPYNTGYKIFISGEKTKQYFSDWTDFEHSSGVWKCFFYN